MNHNCDDSLERLYLYLDAELDRARSENIRSHLEVCSDCFGSFDFEERLKQVVHDRLQEDVPEHLVEKIKAAIHKEQSGAAGDLT